MQYVPLGKTGLNVSRLGFGAMRLPMQGQTVDRAMAVPMLHRAFEAGINYVDTAVFYNHEDSQRAVGEALKGWRDRIVVSTKNHAYTDDEREWWTNLENSLERLDVSYIDLYNTHGIGEEVYDRHVRPHILRWMEKARDQGLIRHVCTSFHGTRVFFRRMVDDGFYESVTVQYNLLDRTFEEELAYAGEAGMGVVVMGPVAGGRLGGHSEVLGRMIPDIRRIPELALRFVLANPHVDVALSGMSTVEQVDENARAASLDEPLTLEDQAVIHAQTRRLAELSRLYCTGCGYCLPCPAGVDIPRVFNLYNMGRVYGLWDHAREGYAALSGGDDAEHRPADACTACGLCRSKCPQQIPIPEQLQAAHKALSGSGGGCIR